MKGRVWYLDMIRIEKVIKKDCKELSILKKRIWNTTYTGIYPDDKLKNYDFQENENKFIKMIEKHNQELYGVYDENKLIGYFSFGKILRSFQHYTHDIGLLYLMKEYQGKGIGTSILSFCKDRLYEMGVTEFIISCNKYNIHAQNFYKKNGGLIIHIDQDDEDHSLPQVKFLFKK